MRTNMALALARASFLQLPMQTAIVGYADQMGEKPRPVEDRFKLLGAIDPRCGCVVPLARDAMQVRMCDCGEGGLDRCSPWRYSEGELLFAEGDALTRGHLRIQLDTSGALAELSWSQGPARCRTG